ncbi:MAG: sodium-translocating pyrophosphatase [Chlorobi bacterium]|nr:sodium-translocating pyrophosphatase [Chlorobiota bacterium]
METLIYSIIGAGIAGIVFTVVKSAWVQKQSAGSEKMQTIAGHIADGAMAFLKAEYKVLSVFVAAVAILLYLKGSTEETSNGFIALSFVTGAVLSALAGFIGMRIAVKANVRTTNAARKSMNSALKVAFTGGSVMGLGVVSLGVLGLSILFIFYHFMGFDGGTTEVLNVLSGFSLGASSIALFARVGGGIYTKAADVGADLVGKVESGIPEDHPLNPATIADNVGDNVGDVAGMGADLFESFVGSIVATMVLGAVFMNLPEFSDFPVGAVLLPLTLAAAGIIISGTGTFFVRIKEGGNPHTGLNTGEAVSATLMLAASYFIIKTMLPESWSFTNFEGITKDYSSLNVFFATVTGLIAGFAIGKITEYYTGTGNKPVLSIVKKSRTGAATNIIGGLEIGMLSTALPVIVIALSIIGAYYFAGLYGIAVAAVGMLANTGIQLAIDAYGPIADNAGGIAAMAELEPEVRDRTDKLDAVGNTTAAIGKGFAIGSAALTALALFTAFMQQANIKVIDLANPLIISGLFFGAMLPLLFSALAMGAVGRAAGKMIDEVRRQFKDIPVLKDALLIIKKYDGKTTEASDEEKEILLKADGSAEYEKCVAISTKSSLKEMILPGLLALFVPALVGFFAGAEVLGGVLAGVTSVGVIMAIFQANAGGAWDNAKKMVEEGIKCSDGEIFQKGSEMHKATVVGDTVGDPLKDTSGPSLNILVKLMSIVALVIAPSIAVPVKDAPESALKSEKQIKKLNIRTANDKSEIASFNDFINQKK